MQSNNAFGKSQGVCSNNCNTRFCSDDNEKCSGRDLMSLNGESNSKDSSRHGLSDLSKNNHEKECDIMKIFDINTCEK